VPQDPSDEPASVLLERILIERQARWEVEQRAKGKEPRKIKYAGAKVPETVGVPQLPKGWCWTSLDQLSWDAGYGTSQKCDYEAPGPPVLRIPNVSKGSIDLGDLKHARSNNELPLEAALAPGDLLVIRTNGSKDLIGRSALVRQLFSSPHYFASYLIRFRLVAIRYVPEWIAAIWDSMSIRNQITSMAATSAGQYNVSLSLAKVRLPLPPLDEQRLIIADIEQRLSVAQELETSIEADLRRSERLRQAILARAFAGQLVPQDPNDEPASALLDQIQAARQAKVLRASPGAPRQVSLPL
jgi:type I restriction enzyme, S subunit